MEKLSQLAEKLIQTKLTLGLLTEKMVYLYSIFHVFLMFTYSIIHKYLENAVTTCEQCNITGLL